MKAKTGKSHLEGAEFVDWATCRTCSILSNGDIGWYICSVVYRGEEGLGWIQGFRRGADVSFGFSPALLLLNAYLTICESTWGCRAQAVRYECWVHRRYTWRWIWVPPWRFYDSIAAVEKFLLGWNDTKTRNTLQIRDRITGQIDRLRVPITVKAPPRYRCICVVAKPTQTRLAARTKITM